MAQKPLDRRRVAVQPGQVLDEEEEAAVARPVRRSGPWPPGQARGPMPEPRDPSTSVRRRSDLSIYMHPGLTDACSISHVMRNLALALYRGHGADVCWEYQANLPQVVSCPSYLGQTECMLRKPTEPYVRFGWGVNADLMPPGDPLEYGRMLVVTSDHGWVKSKGAIKRMTEPHVSLLMTLSPECEEVLVEAGVPRERIARLRLGVDPDLYRPEGPQCEAEVSRWLHGNKPEEGAFTFLTAGYMQPRKGGRETVEAFCRAFEGRRDVALIVKNVVDRGRWGKDETEAYEQIMRKYDAPPVGYMQAVLSEYQMAALLRDVDCVVNMHRREGFGLMMLQAMACGTPTLITDFHGPRQYATQDNCYILPIVDKQPETTSSPGDDGEKIDWAVYDLDTAAALMWEAAGRTRERSIVRAGLETAKEWTWFDAAESFVETLETNIGHLRTRPTKWFSPKMLYSVVMPVRHGVEKLVTTLKTLHDVCEPPEVIVYDDAGTMDEYKQITDECAKYPTCKLVRGEKQVGCHGARQRLFEMARGEFIVSIDGDMDFSQTRSDWFDVLEYQWAVRQHGIMHPLLVWPKNEEGEYLVQSAGANFFVDLNNSASGAAHRLENMAETEDVVQQARKIEWGCGAFQFFHQQLLEIVDMPGESIYYPVYFGDVAFCFAARAAGYPVWYCPEVTVIHDANTWCKSSEAANPRIWIDSMKVFWERWRDMAEEGKRVRDETGALP